MDELDDIVHEFLVESQENLDQLDRDLVALEQHPESTPLLQSIFRTIHTIKGTCGFLAFSQLEALTHAGEGLLGRLRDGGLTLSKERASALLELVDAVRDILGSIETTGAEDGRDRVGLIAKLTRLQEPDAVAPDQSGPVDEAPIELPPPRLGEILVDVAGVAEDAVTMAVLEQRLGDERPIGQILVDSGLATEAQVETALAAQADSKVSDSSIRVDVGLLDTLMRLVGELVLTRNQIVTTATECGDAAMLRSSQQLNQLVSELQAGVMKTRMQPIDSVWSRLPRVVRDLALSCGRQVRLELHGRDIELDKTILEAIKDPLTHVVRNSIDHGIEPADVRLAAGKPAEGRLTLRAFHEGGQVNIEISDDGAGIDPVAVAAKAVQRGLITRAQAAAMSARELTNLIFVAGFSTAQAITNVSGRGVGMDVVRTNIEKIGGTVDVASEPGVGTTLSIKIPLTLAIIPALTVECAAERYAIPQVSIEELVSLDGDQVGTGVEQFAGAPVFRLRGKIVPLVWLGQLLDQPAPLATGALTVLVLTSEGCRFGLVVERVLNAEEIVVKPLSRQLQQIGAYLGATILGDGRIALILDVRSLARRAHVVRERDVVMVDESDGPAAKDDTAEALLIVAVAERRIGIPLSAVTRLEEVATSDVEHAGEHDVVQYRGQLLRLGRLSAVLGCATPADSQPDLLDVIVYTHGDLSVGFVVDAVLDIAGEVPGSRRVSDDPGVCGVTVVQGRATEVLDMEYAIRWLDPAFFAALR